MPSPSFMARIRDRFEDLGAPGDWADDRLQLDVDSARLGTTYLDPQDVTAISSPEHGQTAYNDGTVGTEGPAFYDGTDWVSTVDGTVIA